MKIAYIEQSEDFKKVAKIKTISGFQKKSALIEMKNKGNVWW